MKTNRVLTGLLVTWTAASVCFGQSDSLRTKILNIIGAKRADVGVAIQGSHPADTLFVHGDRHYPMQSVYKLHLAFTVLDLVDQGKLSLDQKILVTSSDLPPRTWSPLRERYPGGNVELTLQEILTSTVSESDNNGCDILFRLIGGTGVANAHMHSLGVTDVAIAATEQEMHRAWDVQYRNWTTPRAALELLVGFRGGQFLSAESRQVLWRLLVGTSTGPKRLKGLLPESTIVAHKTGSSGKNEHGLSAATNDMGIIVLPDGRWIAIAVFVTESYEDEDTNERMIAEIAKAIWDSQRAQ